MRVFVTGATGFIGSAVVRELIDTGHEVVGLARSDAAEASLAAVGAQVRRGSLDDLDGLRAGAAAADGVIHTAYIHDFTDFAAAARTDRLAIEAIGDVLAGSDRPLVFASGTAGIAPGEVVTEDTVPEPGPGSSPRIATEAAAIALAERGVRVAAVRLPPTVHGEGDHGFMPRLIDVARTKGVSAYPGAGRNRWPAVHRLDAAHLFRLALEAAPAGSRLHGVGEEGVPVRDIAEAFGRQLGVPVTSIPVDDATDHFGFLGPLFAMDMPASSARTRKEMDWQPVHPTLVADIDAGHYFAR